MKKPKGIGVLVGISLIILGGLAAWIYFHNAFLPAESNFYDLIGMRPDELKAVHLTYEGKGEKLTLAIQKESDWYSKLTKFLNQRVKKEELPMDLYQTDPITMTLQSESGQEEVSFVTAEDNQSDAYFLYVVWKRQSFRLTIDREAVASLLSPNMTSRDIIPFYFWQCIFRYGRDLGTEKEKTNGLFILEGDYRRAPEVYGHGTDLEPMEELIRRPDAIFIATIKDQGTASLLPAGNHKTKPRNRKGILVFGGSETEKYLFGRFCH